MGASISRSTTPTELAALVPMLGAAYEAYASIVVDNGVNGSFIFSFSTKEEIAETLVDLGVTNKAHHRLITTCILEAIEAEAAAHSTVFASPSSSSPSHPAPAQSPLASAAGGGSASPSSFTCAPTMVFLTHNWNNGNHARVSGVNRGLQSRGVVTWFDSDRMTGSIRKTMADGIENTGSVMVFITREYRDKVNGADARDNCQYEFNHAVEQLGPQRMIPVVMEAEMRNSRDWRGVLGAALGTLLYVDMVGIDESSGQAFEAKMDELAALARGIAGGGKAATVAASASKREAPEGTGWRIYKTVEIGDMAALGPLVLEWIGYDVLNWANPDMDGWTPLMIGSARDKVEAVRLLLATPGADVNKGGYSGATAIMLAGANGHTEVVRALLAAPGIDLNKRDTDGQTALSLAIEYNKPEAVALLRAAGAEEEQAPQLSPATAPNPYAGRYASKSQADIAANRAKKVPKSWGLLTTPVGKQILDATFKGDMAVLLPLVDEWFANDVLNWANPDEFGRTPLIAGSREGKVEAVRLLLATPGIDVNKVTEGGMTAIMYAAYGGHTDVVRALLAAPRIDLNKRVTGGGYKGKTALGLAIWSNKPEIAALLRAAGVEE